MTDNYPNVVDTEVVCPACGQKLTVTDGSVECGGEGEGSCDGMYEGAAGTADAEAAALASARG